jgi:hypothetical protein
MDGSDARRSVADCGGCAPLAARVGLAMLPVMDRCPNHSRITTENVFVLKLFQYSPAEQSVYRHEAPEHCTEWSGLAVSY